jgi:hypothetical protein
MAKSKNITRSNLLGKNENMLVLLKYALHLNYNQSNQPLPDLFDTV